MAYYVSETPGVGGRVRDRPADFRVREIERFDIEALDSDPGSYPHLVFEATLAGWDTNDFADVLSSKLGVSRERVSWAGTKDKRAVTTQLFSIRAPELDPTGFPEIREADIRVRGRAGRPVLFGDLAGNEFDVVVRDSERPANVEAITTELRAFAGDSTDSVGVPNYFGQQRFGSRRAVTHLVGLAIAHGEWEDAVRTYLAKSTDREPEGTRAAREFIAESHDWESALSRMPDHLRYERSMLHSLAETGGDHPADFRTALEALPENLQSLFVNAAQSYAFNLMVSRRLDRELPFNRAVEGDVVCFADTDDTDGLTRPDTDRLQRVTADRLETVNRHCERGRAFVTAPLVGTETELGEGRPGEIERAVLADLGLTQEDFDRPGEFASTGTRRAIQVRTDIAVDDDPLTFRFALPKGSYATVLLREYLKTDPGGLA